MALVEIKDIYKEFRSDGALVRAVRGVDLSVEEGEFIALAGPSGSGKSTLLSLMGGITLPTKGDLLVDGIRLSDLDGEALADFRREYVGFVFQQFHLIPYLTALENVMTPLFIEKGKDLERRAIEALESVGMAEKARRLPSRLSGGEQQRVAIARALVNEPPLILADEPTGNLDTDTGNEIFSLFSDLNRKGKTIVMVTHNSELASRTGRIVSMRDGVIVETPETKHQAAPNACL